MQKRTTFTAVITAVLVALAVSATQALAAVKVYASEIPDATVATAAVPASVSNAPVPAANAEGGNATEAGSPRVRIDASGVHVGGPKPVDINIPSFAHHQDRGIDVVGIVGVVFGCMVPIAIVSIIFYFRHRRLKMHHETMRAMIEKGMPIPPEMAAGARGDLLLGSSDVRPGRSDVRSGLILIAVGAGLLMIAGKVGWILVFIGAARLVLWLIDSRN